MKRLYSANTAPLAPLLNVKSPIANCAASANGSRGCFAKNSFNPATLSAVLPVRAAHSATFNIASRFNFRLVAVAKAVLNASLAVANSPAFQCAQPSANQASPASCASTGSLGFALNASVTTAYRRSASENCCRRASDSPSQKFAR